MRIDSRLILIVLCLCGAILCSSQDVRKDSVFVHLNPNNKPVTIVYLSKGKTLYSIARQFGIVLSDLISYNGINDPTQIKENEAIHVPVNLHFKQAYEGAVPVYYRVKPQDNLYAISKRYFGISVEEIKKWNNLTTETISPGQALTVAWIYINQSLALSASKIDSIQMKETVKDSSSSVISVRQRKPLVAVKSPQLKFNPSELRVIKRGVAYWEEQLGNSSRHYALHKSAPVGSYIEIINPILERRVYAKVVGSITADRYTRDIQVVVSRGVARALGAVDQRFFVEVRSKK